MTAVETERVLSHVIGTRFSDLYTAVPRKAYNLNFDSEDEEDLMEEIAASVKASPDAGLRRRFGVSYSLGRSMLVREGKLRLQEGKKQCSSSSWVRRAGL
jgi:hypothetical protein